MPRKIPKTLTEVRFLPNWDNDLRFIMRAYRLLPSKKQTTFQHFLGGPAYHQKAGCSKCRRPLTLMWDIDLRDPAIPEHIRQGFAPATRLPLYNCWACMCTGYLVASDTVIRCLDFAPSTDYINVGDSPFMDSPNELPRRKAAMILVPSKIEGLRALADDIGKRLLDEEGLGILVDYYGPLGLGVDSSQFGGRPVPYQGINAPVCVNPKCCVYRAYKKEQKIDSEYRMKCLALLSPEDEPSLQPEYFQLMYFVCGVCYCVVSQYHCT